MLGLPAAACWGWPCCAFIFVPATIMDDGRYCAGRGTDKKQLTILASLCCWPRCVCLVEGVLWGRFPWLARSAKREPSPAPVPITDGGPLGPPLGRTSSLFELATCRLFSSRAPITCLVGARVWLSSSSHAFYLYPSQASASGGPPCGHNCQRKQRNLRRVLRRMSIMSTDDEHRHHQAAW